MAHFARLDENNIVQEVLVVPNEQEHRGQEFLVNEIGLGGRWIQTSYNKSFRKNNAGYGFYYDEELDAFIAPRPYTSWSLNQETCRWEPPKTRPEGDYSWDEDSLDWVLV